MLFLTDLSLKSFTGEWFERYHSIARYTDLNVKIKTVQGKSEKRKDNLRKLQLTLRDYEVKPMLDVMEKYWK